MTSGVGAVSYTHLRGVESQRMELEGEGIRRNGGLAKKIVPHCKREIILDEELLLRGLLIIYEKNK